jgi:Kdo2-lipid IVA lauroyltransferase/acyltransferase
VRNEALWQHSRHFLNIRPAYVVGQMLLENFPLQVGYAAAWAIASVAQMFSPNQRAGIQGNLRQALGHLEPGLAGEALERRVKALAREVFLNRGRWFLDMNLLACRRSTRDLFRYTVRGDWARLRECVKGGRGAILASAHLGNWHGGGVMVARHGFPVRAVMYRNMAGDAMDLGVARRGGVGQAWVDGDPFSMVELVRALRRGEILAMLADNPWDSRSEEVPFFGRPARFPVGPTRLARLAGVPIFPAFCTWTRPREYDATLCDPIEVAETGDPREVERDALHRLVRVIEDFVGRNLPVWFNFEPAWGQA